MKGWLLVVIIIIGLFFRIYNFEKGFSYAHDADLYSWIAKDIVSGHQRLIGQLTSVDGVFIGSFYYYLMAIFYWVFGMNPLGAIVPLTLIGLFDCWCVYYIFSRHFGKKVGLTGVVVWAVSWGIASFERWSVPTEPTFTWAIWFLALIIELYKGNLKYLWLYGLLVGFTWQLHIALLPVLPIPMLAYVLGKNSIKNLWCKESILGVIVLFLAISPFVLFEVKHNFSQIKAMAVGIGKDWNGPKGWLKFEKIIDASGKEFQVRLFEGWEDLKPTMIWWVIVVVSGILYVKNIDRRILLFLWVWIGLIMLAQFVSKRVVSEYYFSNLIPVIVLIFSLFLANFSKKFLFIFLGGYLLANTYWVFNRSEADNSYYFRNRLVEEIKKDVIKNGYNCVAINYIADPGVGVGFRYLMWWHGIDLVKTGIKDVPVYNISIPWQLVMDESPVYYGRFGVLIPNKTEGISKEDCEKMEYQLDPLLGYTE